MHAVDALLGRGERSYGCLQMVGTCLGVDHAINTSPTTASRSICIPYMSTLQFGDHVTTKGGSCATSSLLIRSTYRQAYFPDRRDAFTGFRTCAL